MFTVLTFTATIFFAEIIGGYYSGSLALISDAMHMLSDTTGLVVAAVAIVFGRKAASRTATYGYKRIEVIAALANALSVSIISVWILFEAVERFSNGQVVNSTTMLVVGVIGFIANLFGAFILHQHSHENLNMKGAYLHVLVDLFGSVAVIIAAVVMKQFNIMWADTVASLLIASLILPRSLKLAWESLRVLLEQAPSKANTQEILQALRKLDEVVAVHDLHVWSLDGSELIATCHMVVDMQVPAAGCDVLDRVQKELRKFGIEHSTVQLETPHHHTHETTC
ncbi:cation diffusion facilitator family transporter [Corynebacterium sp. HS2168-gen11]|nr:cation diffusion facilitator family transporter [Corynebacterium sp. HS2168-gen11]